MPEKGQSSRVTGSFQLRWGIRRAIITQASEEGKMDQLKILSTVIFWVLAFLFFWKIPTLRKREGGVDDPPSVSIIVPARNEAGNIGRLLGSLREQTRQPREVIVVDDQSEDATPLIAEKEGATVLSLTELPEGWRGKNWACWQGAGRARGEILLFLDADTWMEKDGLQKISETFLRTGGLLSIQPYHRVERLYEQLSAFFSIINMAGTQAFTILGKKIKPVGAFGPCLVCRREDYFAVGGHAKVKGEILESLALGQEFLSCGRDLHCFGGRGTISFRMYPGGLRSLIEGFGKGFAIGANRTSWVCLLLIIGWVSGAMGLTRQLVQALLGFGSSDWFLGSTLYFLYAAQIYWMLARIGSFRWHTAFLFPIPLLFFVAVFFWSLLTTFVFKKVRWKGRQIDTGTAGKEGP
jgi:4,4'-diaponeurosporenoate glycosyltransferase